LKYDSITWNEVIAVHRTIRGVNLKQGEVISLLAGNESHQDTIDQFRVTYTVPYRAPYQWDRKCMDNALEKRTEITVFKKIAKNKWHNLGRFRIINQEEDQIGIKYTLNPV